MKKCLTVLISVAIIISVWFAAIAVNSRGRIDCRNVSYAEIEESGPFILSGGTYSNKDGKETYTLTFFINSKIYMYFPRQNNFVISGCSTEQLEVSNGHLFCITPNETGEVGVEIISNYDKLEKTETYVYIGNFKQLNDFVSTSIICNQFVRGLCFGVILSSLIIFFLKRSEKYLLWIALLALFVGYYGRLRNLLIFFGLSFMAYEHIYWLQNELLISFFTYMAFKEFMPVKLGKLPFLVFSTMAAVPAFLYLNTARPYIYSMLFFYTVLYTMYFICIMRMPETCKMEKHIFLLSWLLTTLLRTIELFCLIGLLPSGDIDLRFRIRGIIAVIFVIALFICAIKRFAERFERSDRLNAELEKKIREKSLENISFIRSMLHNLKTPLFSVIGYTDMAMRTIEKKPTAAKQYVDKANEKAIYAGHLMDTLSLAMRVGTGQLKLSRVPLDFAETAKKCAETASPASMAKNILISCSLDEPMPLKGDPMYLQQAVENIIDNAIINTPENGKIEIFAEKSPDAQKQILHIRDNGCGIEESEIDRIFEAYYSKRSTGSSSSGLGLYITKEIINLHGGEISVESSPGKGADFILSLPAANQASVNT